MSEPLLPRIASGDTRAVEACLDRYGALVWTLALRFTKNRHEAEDAAQEVFIELWKKAPRYDAAIAAESTFIALIARRHLIDRSRRRSSPPPGDVELDELPSTRAAEVERIDLADEASRAAAALEALKPEQQRVLRLSIFDGLSHQEIAERTALPLGTVKTHVRRGLERVREILGRTSPATPMEGYSS
ncbi:MAG: RNA polymerase sigma factor [Planctomycetota bacterium]